MTEAWTILGFLVLMTLLVLRIVKERRQQDAWRSQPSLKRVAARR